VHSVLIELLCKKITDESVIKLLSNLINSSNQQESVGNYIKDDNLFTPIEITKGLPLGNQTSQFFGNIYLNGFDHFIKEQLKIKGYIRYVDDMLFFDNSKEFLETIIYKSQQYLNTLQLKLHPLKINLLPSSKGYEFLGHKVFKTHFRVTNSGIRRARKNLKKVKYQYNYDKIDLVKAKNKIFSTTGFLNIGKGHKITTELLANTTLKKM